MSDISCVICSLRPSYGVIQELVRLLIVHSNCNVIVFEHVYCEVILSVNNA